MRHLISIEDLTTAEIQHILQLAIEMKSTVKSGTRDPIFSGMVLGFVFEKPSLRTRVSFESLMKQHAGSTIYLGEEAGFGKREPLEDFVPILSSYVDVLVMRTKQHELITRAAELALCPVINGLTSLNHPCQAFADILTVQELFGQLDSVKIAYVGDANNVTRSLAVLCSKLGVRLAIGAPQAYQFEPDFVDHLNRQAGKQLITQMTDPHLAVAAANVVYTDVWASMGQEDQQRQRINDLAEFQVNRSLMQSADNNARFLHCLPARRGEEVTAEVIDGPQSAILQQAENRLHAQKGLVRWLLFEVI